MRYSFRLAELLGHSPHPRKRPGTIKDIVEHTGLDRHQVAALLKNEVKYIPLEALSRLCDYLIDKGKCTADQLPGALFAVEPEYFWELLAHRGRIELCLGVRRPEQNWLEGAWVTASDSVLLGVLLNGISTLGGTAEHLTGDAQGELRRISASAPRLEHFHQSLVWSPGQAKKDEVMARAREVKQHFNSVGADRALVCIGSIKSNPVVELVMAEAFGGEPFKTEDDVSDPRQRSCPIFLRYREGDPHPESCCGGVQLAKSAAGEKPGLYYENADGEWDCCAWDEGESDAAYVFYVHRESQGRLEMAVGGFSGRGTRLLARTLSAHPEWFWPPVYSKHGVQIGAYIAEFKVPPQDATARDILLRTDMTAPTNIIPLSENAVARRFESTAV